MPDYGSATAVKQMLGPDATVYSADDDARIAALLKMASRTVEQETGAVFGDGATAVREVWGEGGETLALPVGIRSVTSIVEGPTTWTGSAWTGGSALATADWRFGRGVVRQVSGSASTTAYRTLLRVGGAWSGLYVVTGLWGDRLATVPDAITYAVNVMAKEQFKREMASPAGEIGPDGSVLPLRDWLREPAVRSAVAAWRVGPQAVAL